jgi:hypothetical protein
VQTPRYGSEMVPVRVLTREGEERVMRPPCLRMEGAPWGTGERAKGRIAAARWEREYAAERVTAVVKVPPETPPLY